VGISTGGKNGEIIPDYFVSIQYPKWIRSYLNDPKKRKMKEAFDSEYDDRGGEEKTFLDLEKEKLEQQSQV